MISVVRLRLIVAGISCVFAGAASAAPITIDFDSYTASSDKQVDTLGYTFRVEDVVAGSMSLSAPYAPGTDNPLTYGNSSILFARADGGLFNLESLDVYHWSTSNPWGDTSSHPYTVTGYRADDTEVQMSSVGLADLSWHTLSPAWTNLEAVKVSTSFDPGAILLGAIDNVVVTNVVPLPPAVYLFGSALAWLAARCRPRK